jgi:hypothetical protein
MVVRSSGFHERKSPGGGSGAGMLDSLSISASAAWSTRKLRSAYASNCMKVRRSSDNATQDIGFSGGVLDTASLLSFAGSGDAFIQTWYDQSGNGYDATQATNSKQPKIVAAGVVETIGSNSRPSPFFISANSTELRFPNGPIVTGTNPSTMVGVGKQTTIGANNATPGWLCYGNTGTGGGRAQLSFGIVNGNVTPSPFSYAGHSTYGGGHDTVSTTQIYNTILSVIGIWLSTPRLDTYINGTLNESATGSNPTSTFNTSTTSAVNQIGCIAGSVFWDGLAPELILFSSAMGSTDMATVVANQKTFIGF